ncbi:Secreted protein [Pseudomonas sp. IT-P44]
MSVVKLTIFCYPTLVLLIDDNRPPEVCQLFGSEKRGGSPKEHSMSITSFYCRGKGLFSKFALTSSFHGPPRARVRSA